MSATAASRSAPLDGSPAARLIPGFGISRTTSARHKQWIQTGKLIELKANNTPADVSSSATSVASLIFPDALVVEDPYHLWPLVKDYAVILFSWAIGWTLVTRMGFGWLPLPSQPLAMNAVWDSAGVGLLFAVVTTLLAHSEGLYRPTLTGRRRLAIVGKSLLWAAVLLCLTVIELAADALATLGTSTVLSFLGLLTWRCWHDRAASSPSHPDIRNVLIVGAGRAGREMAAYLKRHPELQRVVRGFLDKDPAVGVLGSPHQLAAIARAEFVDEVILAACEHEMMHLVLREARKHHLDVKVIPCFDPEITGAKLESLGSIPVVSLNRESPPAVGLCCKRMLDVVLSLFGMAVTAPLLLLIAGVIRLDNPGPVLYRAWRVGKKGRRFRCYKFRTMVQNAGEMKESLRRQNQRQGPCFKMADDPRITPVGRILRRYSLDELPQLWNVFRGDMSLVGPRPHPLDDFARYELQHFPRLDVTPGITGLWQVSARQNPSFQANMALDLHYIERWSLWMDFKILLKTVVVVFQGTGA